MVCDQCGDNMGVIYHNEWESMSDIRFELFQCEKCLMEEKKEDDKN
jgi:hypothetical protein